MIGPELLRNKAIKTLKRLAKFSQSRAVRKKMSQDTARSKKKMDKYIRDAIVSLQQLPDVQIVCATEQFCAQVDNSAAIKQHIRALNLLRGQIIRSLNRATRLAYPTVAEAQAATKKYGREVKSYAKKLIAKAKALPPTRNQCS